MTSSSLAATVVVESLFHVDATEPTIADEDRPFDASEYELLQKTQLALVKCPYILRAAIRDPKIASLPLLLPMADPVSWLRANLEVDFLEGSEILSIRLRGSDGDVDQLRQIVDAVARAYTDEAIYAARLRMLNARDAKAKAIDKLRKKLEEKLAHIKDEQTKSGDSGVALKLDQAEADVLTDTWRSLLRSLEIDDVNTSGAPSRIHILQEATVISD